VPTPNIDVDPFAVDCRVAAAVDLFFGMACAKRLRNLDGIDSYYIL
jgi:hypothetical protein